MEMVLLIGLQASGKSTFAKARFGNSHIRINLDMLRTRHREKRLVETCLEIKQPFVVDNTNPTRSDRTRYIELAKTAKFRIFGYYFQSVLEDCIRRNSDREGSQKIPIAGLLNVSNRLEMPNLDEGFDLLHFVRISADGEFVVEGWSDEVR
jgi:predicted kinase